MVRFLYRIRDPQGVVREGVVEGTDAEVVRQRIEARSYQVLSLQPENPLQGRLGPERRRARREGPSADLTPPPETLAPPPGDVLPVPSRLGTAGPPPPRLAPPPDVSPTLVASQQPPPRASIEPAPPSRMPVDKPPPARLESRLGEVGELVFHSPKPREGRPRAGAGIQIHAARSASTLELGPPAPRPHRLPLWERLSDLEPGPKTRARALIAVAVVGLLWWGISSLTGSGPARPDVVEYKPVSVHLQGRVRVPDAGDYAGLRVVLQLPEIALSLEKPYTEIKAGEDGQFAFDASFSSPKTPTLCALTARAAGRPEVSTPTFALTGSPLTGDPPDLVVGKPWKHGR